MSVIETAYVEVLPKTDGFEQKLVADTSAAASKAGAAASKAMGGGPGGGPPNDPLDSLKRNAAEAQSALEKTYLASQRANAEFLVGATSEAKAAAAAEAYALAGLAAAKANVELALATGEAAAASDLHILSMRRETAEAQRSASTFRGQARNVIEGNAGVGSLLGPASLLKFTAAGFAINAALTTVNALTEGLKVDGDAAYTTEGRLRNLGAALLSGNLVDGFHALNDQAATASERLETLKGSAATTPVDLRNLGEEATRTANKVQGVVDVQEALGTNDAVHDAFVLGIADMREAASEATALANALETSATAANDVGAAIKAAGSEAAAFGEANRIGGQGARPGQGQPATDATATNSTENAIARSRAARTAGLQDDLAQAKKEAAQAATLERNQKDVIEGRAARHQATVEAQTRAIQIQNQIDDEAARAAEAAAAKREQDAKNAAAEAKRVSEAEATAYRQSLSDRELLLQLGARRAELTEKDFTDDRAAARKLIKFYEAEAHDVKLTVAERRQAAISAVNERLALRDIGKKVKDDAGAGFSIQDLFVGAADQFRTYGSNIAGRNGILSPQDARADLAQSIIVQLQSRALSESERQTVLLASIDRRLGGESGPARRRLEEQRYATVEGLRGTAMAAAYGYGVN